MKKILTVGCSHTEGSECSTSWPTEFGILADCEVVNVAKGGASNYLILNAANSSLNLFSASENFSESPSPLSCDPPFLSKIPL